MKLFEVDDKLPGKPLKQIGARAGVYPVHTNEEGKMFVYMMVPSNPKFGGPLPQLGKGGIDPGESAEQAAMREGVEELGLIPSNVARITQLTTTTIRGKKEQYSLTVFVAELKDPDDFDPHGWEAKWAGWVELEEAIKVSRKNQQQFLHLLKSKYNKQQPLDEAVDDKDEKIAAYETYATELQAKLDSIEDEIKGIGARDYRVPDDYYKQRNKLQAQIAHAKSQIDLISRLDVDPLPAEENDPSLSWGEWAKSLAPVIKRIKAECQPYLDAIEYNVLEYRLYRGMKGTDAPYMTGRVRLTGRKPQATGTHVHEAVNGYFIDQFGEPFRNALFTSSNPNFAADYGNLFIVFPTGKFKFIWSPHIEDLYNHEWALDEALDDDKADDDMPSDDYHFRLTMDNYEYQNTDFIGAMESKQEIMIRTPVYYGINLSNFWHRNDDDDDSVGTLSEINQAMKIIQELLTDEDV